ncbi:ATPase domain-containing protein [Massilia yuzhufengensis]|uniref:non-specific serine/threonine protein kinase n=1 Tax=Massilia yuzhufengensis TaxID=1164594 RepID=A0A1I1IG11_9BURK|nr:ATPase domain-containing protein [Massilia yuzhufengensis]SFC35216.1 circadian clock protein KaiC [Massilia yuzhufengensis]
MTDQLELGQLRTGIPGLDTILGGGLPELSFNIIGGTPGSGKTTFAQQVMFGLARPGRKALFFTAMGEPPVKMLRYQQQFSFFDFDKVGDSVHFISLAPQVELGDYDVVLAQILEQVRAHQPALVFIDSFRSFIEGARGDNQETAALQTFVQHLVAHMTTWKATSFLIGEYTSSEAHQNPIFTVADGIFWLNQVVQRNAMSRKLQIVKIRGQKQRPGLHAFRIDKGGIEVFPRVLPAPEPVGAEPPMHMPPARLSTGVPVLDEMMGGGIPSGYSVLVVGPTGSGKTILATEFLGAGAAKGEAGVVALFERSPSQLMNEKLDRLVRAGQVGLMSVRALDLSVDEMLHELLGMIDAKGATRVVLDSLSGFEMAMSPEYREDFRESLYRMTTVLAAKGVTVMMTSELEDRFGELRFSPYGSGVLVDAVIMQRYVESQCELHTLISVIKVRGSKHSRQIRRFEVTDAGIAIGDGPAPFDNVLRGSAQPREASD